MKPFAYRVANAPLEAAGLRILALSLHEAMPSGMVHRPQGLSHYLLVVLHTESAIRGQGVTHRLSSAKPDPLGAGHLPGFRQCRGAVGIFLARLRWAISAVDVRCPGAPPQCDHRHVVPSLPRPLPPLSAVGVRAISAPRSTAHPQPTAQPVAGSRAATCSPDETASLPSWAIAIKQYLEVNYALPITLEGLAELTHLYRHIFSGSSARCSAPPRSNTW